MESPPEIAVLDARLAEVKALFKQKYGCDVEEDQDDDDQSCDEPKTHIREDDGITWEVTRGTMESPPEISALDSQLAEVKALFKQKHGYDVDEEGDDEQSGDEREAYMQEDDGITWEVTRGTAESPPKMSVLDAELLEVKALFKQKYGSDVDDDDDDDDQQVGSEHKTYSYTCVEGDIHWEVSKGTQESPPEISALEARLDEVKALFEQKYGSAVDEESDTVLNQI